MPPGINAGKVINIESLAKSLGIGDGELALLKVDALIFIRDASNEEVGETLGDEYNPTTLSETIDCLVHQTLKAKMQNVMESIDNAVSN